jgi:hypothetical protein
MPRTREPAPPPSVALPDGFVKESALLLSVDKSRPDIEWPTFDVRNATVYSKDYQSLEDLLKVERKGPFPIRGRLYTDPDDERQTSACMFLCLIASLACDMIARTLTALGALTFKTLEATALSANTSCRF